MTDAKVAELEKKVVELQFHQKETNTKLTHIEEGYRDNKEKLDATHTLVTKIDKTLSIIFERLTNNIDNNVKLEVRQDKVEHAVNEVENTLTLQAEKLSNIIGRQKSAEVRATKELDSSANRRWSMATLIPFALVTALVSGGVSLGVSSVKQDRVAIKQTQIDKLQAKLEKLQDKD